MEGSNFLKNSQIIVLGICIALGTIFSSYIFSQSILKFKKFSTELISVTGSAEKKITSDLMVWKLDFSKRDSSMTQAYQQLQADSKTVKDYLISKGIKNDELILAPIQTSVIYRKNEKGNNTNEIEAYGLTQEMEVRSTDVSKITEVSRQATELINQGIDLVSCAPEYFYTKLAELKITMLHEATQDAKKRAEEIASSSGNKIGVIRTARMGVFQITPVNSYEISDWGTNDTTSLDKKVTAVVKADFAISS